MAFPKYLVLGTLHGRALNGETDERELVFMTHRLFNTLEQAVAYAATCHSAYKATVVELNKPLYLREEQAPAKRDSAPLSRDNRARLLRQAADELDRGVHTKELSVLLNGAADALQAEGYPHDHELVAALYAAANKLEDK